MKVAIIKASFFGAILACSSLFGIDARRVIRLTPPVISPNTISVEYTCMRPTREEGLNISVEDYDMGKNAKTIVNCYGHGSVGWTTLFGSVQKAIELFEKGIPNKSIPIRIIGSGCMGLTTAIELTNRGYKVAGIYTIDHYDSASWKAAGYFGLIAKETTPDEMNQIYDLAAQSFLVYQQIESGKHPFFSKGCAQLMPIYCDATTSRELSFLVNRKLISPKKLVALDFGNGVVHEGMYEYKTFFMNTSKLMKQLTDEVERLNIPIKTKEIYSYYDVKELVVFNCAGLGAKEINGDQKLDAVRGHLITLNSKSGHDHRHYMLSTSMLQDGKTEPLYLIPKTSLVSPKHPDGIRCAGVLGVTFIPHAGDMSDELLKKLDKKEFKQLLNRASMFFNGHPYED